MDEASISKAILQKLASRAKQEHSSVDDLLTRLLDTRPDDEHNLKALIENFDGSSWSIDKNYCFLAGNSVFQHYIQHAIGRNVTRGENLLTLNLPQATLNDWQNLYDRALAGEKFSIETQSRFAPVPRDIEYRFNPIQAADGTIIGVTIFARDFTAQKQAETALRQSEERFKLAAHIARLGVWDWEIASDKTTWYGEMFAIYGVSPEEFTGKGADYINFTREDYRHAQVDNIQKAFENGVTEAEILAGKKLELNPKELCIVRPDGTERFTRGDAIAIVDEAGKAIRMLGVTVDTTEQRQAQEAIRQSEARLQSIIESQTAYIVRTDMNGHYTYVHDSFFRKFCWQYAKIADVIGQSGLLTILPEDHQLTSDTVSACIQAIGSPIQVLLRKPAPEGAFFWTIWEFVALADAAGNPYEIQCIGIDISELMQARQQLQLQEAALEATATAIMITDKQAQIKWVNPAFTTLTGHSLDEALGQNAQLLKSGQHDESFYQALWETILAGQVWQGEFINKRKDGSSYTAEQTITPVYENGELSHFVAVMQDITIRKQAEHLRLEQERLKASLKKEQEFNTLVQKAVSVLAHDIRTPLSVISITKQMLDRYFDRLDEGQRREKLDSIGKQLNYVLDLLNDMSMTVKGSLDQRQFQALPLKLVSLAQASINEIQETVGKQHQFRFVHDDSIDLVQIDETLVSRILLNLLSNAVKFSDEGSEICLELRRKDAWIVLRVSDQGRGINADDLPHIFEPFYRAEAVRDVRGTGLGLNIVKDCVERHQGRISVETEFGKGTSFIVELPFVEA